MSSRQVPSALRTSGIRFMVESALAPATTTMLPSASEIAVGYQRPAAIEVAGSNRFTSGRPTSSVMCPPGTMTCPLGMKVWPEQNSQEGDGTSRKVLAVGSQTFGFPNRLQVRTLASYSNAT